MTSYTLDVTSISPLSKNKPRQAIVLCHGYGGDGKDISALAIGSALTSCLSSFSFSI